MQPHLTNFYEKNKFLEISTRERSLIEAEMLNPTGSKVYKSIPKSKVIIQSQAVSLRNLEIYIVQLATILSNGSQGSFQLTQRTRKEKGKSFAKQST